MKKQRMAIIGAGASGLFAALEAQSLGFEVSIYESHSVVGGCASWFRRTSSLGALQFDVGATVLDGLMPDSLLAKRLSTWGVQTSHYNKMNKIFYQVPSINPSVFALDCASPSVWIKSLNKIFPQDSLFLNSHFKEMGLLATKLKNLVEKLPHYPLETWTDYKHNLRLIPELPSVLIQNSKAGAINFGTLLNNSPITATLRSWIDMNLLITTQGDAENVLTPWASLALFFYSLGAGTTEGGMRGLMEPLMRKIISSPHISLNLRTRVQSIQKEHKLFHLNIINSNSEALESDAYDVVISTLPRFNTQKLFSYQQIFHERWDWAEQKDSLWGAVTAYVALRDSEKYEAEAFNFHSKMISESESEGTAKGVEGEDVYLSFSARHDRSRCPEGLRVATLSTHTRLNQWDNRSDDESYVSQKNEYQRKFLRHLFQWQEHHDLPQEVLHCEIGTPRSFEHYTGRLAGNVGGLPMNASNTLFHPPSQRTFVPGLYQIGDTSFPGQSVYACALGALSCLEKIKSEL